MSSFIDLYKKQGEKAVSSEKLAEAEKKQADHIARKEAARKICKETLRAAGNDPSQIIIEFDVEACITLPQSNANIIYYQ
jgi:hypothetical protein